MHHDNTSLVQPPSSRLRPVPKDLLLTNPGLMPRHHRLLVAGFALDFERPPHYVGCEAAMRRAHELYEQFDPFGYDAPHCNAGDFRNTKLSVEGILAELDELVARA